MPHLTAPASASMQRHQFAAAYSVLEQAVSEQAFPGAAFSVLARNQVLALDSVGGFTYDRPTEAVTASTVYDLASLTKVIATTSMAMLLYQRGELRSTSPWFSFFPLLPRAKPPGVHVTR